MKKIILSVLSVLMIFSLIGCSGVLHDEKPFVPEKVTIEGGNWFYFDITVWGDNDGNSAQLIINGDDVQSPDTKLPAFEAKTGAALYFTMKKSDLKLNVSYQDDEPAYTPVPGTVRIYVYTDISAPNAYYWDGNFAGPAWPGFAMNKDGAAPVKNYDATMQIASITVTGLPTEYQSLEFYAIGDLVGGWEFKESNKGTVVGDKFTVTYSTPLSVTATGPEGSIPTKPFKVATNGWKNAITTDTAADGNVDISVLNGKKVAILGTVNGAGNFASEDEYKRAGCVWSIQVLGNIE